MTENDISYKVIGVQSEIEILGEHCVYFLSGLCEGFSHAKTQSEIINTIEQVI